MGAAPSIPRILADSVGKGALDPGPFVARGYVAVTRKRFPPISGNRQGSFTAQALRSRRFPRRTLIRSDRQRTRATMPAWPRSEGITISSDGGRIVGGDTRQWRPKAPRNIEDPRYSRPRSRNRGSSTKEQRSTAISDPSPASGRRRRGLARSLASKWRRTCERNPRRRTPSPARS